MLKRNFVNVHSNTATARSAKVRTGWPYIDDFGIFYGFRDVLILNNIDQNQRSSERP